jgi:hypothetical protein
MENSTMGYDNGFAKVLPNVEALDIDLKKHFSDWRL